jgi:hypothetical protein
MEYIAVKQYLCWFRNALKVYIIVYRSLKIPTLTQRPELSYMKRLSLDMNSIDLLPTWQAFIYIQDKGVMIQAVVIF